MLKKKRGVFRTEFTITSSKIFPEIEKYNSQFKNISYKKCCKKRGGTSTEFNIPGTKYFQTQENTTPRSKIFSTKNAGKKQGVCWTEITVLIKNFRIKSKFLDPKYFWGQKNTNVDKVCKNSEGVIGKNSEGLMGKKF